MSFQLPERPNLEHLRSQAKALLKTCNAGEAAAQSRIGAISSPPFALSHAQLTIAREYGFPSWMKLVEHVETVRAKDGIDEEIARRFVKLALSDRPDKLARLLGLYPGLPRFSPLCALVAGDSGFVSKWAMPAQVQEPVGEEGWRPLEYVCYSKTHRLGGDFYNGLLECARLLLDAGADPNTYHLFDGSAKLPVLFGASGEAGHLGITRLLLERGANPDDGESVFHAAQHNRCDILEVLLEHGADISAANPDWGNSPLYFLAGHRPTDPHANEAMLGMQWLLEHGADPNVPCTNNGETPLHALCMRAWGRSAIQPLIEHGANLDAQRSDGRTPYALAAVTGNREAMAVLRSAGCGTSMSVVEAAIADVVEGNPRLLPESPELGPLFVKLAELGNLKGVQTMLDSGMAVDVRGEAGATALHFASFCGRTDVVGLLVARQAPVDVRDSDYSATPLGWAIHGSIHNRNPSGDYLHVMRLLLEAGADRSEVTHWLDEDDDPPPELIAALA